MVCAHACAHCSPLFRRIKQPLQNVCDAIQTTCWHGCICENRSTVRVLIATVAGCITSRGMQQVGHHSSSVALHRQRTFKHSRPDLDSWVLLAVVCANGMLRVLRRPDQLSLLGRSLLSTSAGLNAHPRCQEKQDVPEGHKNSDLRSVTCHIGLNRRRDLSLREDLCLFQPGGKATVKDIFKVATLCSTDCGMQVGLFLDSNTSAGTPGGCFWCA